MPAEAPRTVHIASGSLAEDAGYRTAADLAALASQTGLTYRLVGGLAVSLLHSAHGAPGDLPLRLTADADLGTEDHVLVTSGLTDELRELGYRQTEGNRFVRDGTEHPRVIDILIPTIGDRLETNITRGDLTVDAVPGLRLALDDPPVIVALTTTLSSGETLSVDLALPGIIPAIVLKAYAFNARVAERDLRDLWKLLEIAHSLELVPADWSPMSAQKRDAARVLHARVAPPSSVGATMARRYGLAHARIAALVQAHVPREPQ